MALVGEVFRRLINTSPRLVSEGVADEFIEKLEYKMMMSGYSQNERNVIIREGKARYRNILQKVEDGERPLYRHGSWRKYDRALGKIVKQRKWYGDNDAVFFVEPSPEGLLRKGAEKIFEEEGFSVKVVEKSGVSLKSCLQKSSVYIGKRCEYDECHVCLTKPTGNCSKEGVGYKAWCIPCSDARENYVMHGETGKSARIRSKEHMDNYKRRARSCLWDHVREVHGGVPVSFGWAVTGSFQEPLLRQLDEADRIERETGILMNSKLEWVRPAGVRTTVEQM